MTNGGSPHTWHSLVGTLMALFIAEKQACGYGYAAERGLLGRFDRFLAEQGLCAPALPRDLVEGGWRSDRRKVREPNACGSG